MASHNHRLAILSASSRLRKAAAPGCVLLSEDTIVATKALVASRIFDGFRVLETPEGEDGAANLVRVNTQVLVDGSYPRTAEMIAKEGLEVKRLPVTEVAKLDAGLSCMSLRWAKPDED